MSSKVRYYVSDMAGRMAARRLAGARSFGVFIENLPPIDPQRFVDRLQAERGEKPLRVAILGTSVGVRGRESIIVTTSATEANVWRNDSVARSGVPTAVLLVGPAPKVNSLRTAFPPLTEADLRHELVSNAIGVLDSPERAAFWRAIEGMPSEFPLQPLSHFAAEVQSAGESSAAALMEREWQFVHLLGLIPQRALLTASGPRAAIKTVRRNRTFVARLRSLSSRDRSRLLRIVDDNRTSASKRKCASNLLKFEKRGDTQVLGELEFESVQELLLSARTERVALAEDASLQKRERLDGDVLALELVLSNTPGVKVAAKRYAEAIEPATDQETAPEAITVNRREILPRLKVGTTQATSLFGRLLSEDVWGGVIEAPEAPDHVAALKLLASGHVETTEFRPNAEPSVRWMLARAVNQGLADSAVLSTWDDYAGIRAEMLHSAHALIDHPLLALGADERLQQRAAALLDAYERLLAGIKATAGRLREAGSIEPAKRLFAFALSLDVAFVQSRSDWTAIAAPTHPFHLWRWLTLFEILGRNRDDLSKLGVEALEALVTEPPASAPDIVLSPFALQGRITSAIAFVPIGSFGALPLFGRPTARQNARFRARSLGRVAQRFVRLMPHASLGLRVLLIDPPGVAGVVEDLLSVRSSFDTDESVPLHVVVARTRQPLEGTDEEDWDLEIVGREIRDAAGSLAVLPAFRTLKDVVAELKTIQPHIAVVFDPGEAQELRIGVTSPPTLSPLVVPRAYRYDPFDDRLDVVIAGEGTLFGSYHDIFCELLEVPRSDFIGRRSGASRFARDLEGVAADSVWLVVVDQGIEPTLRIRGAVRLDWRSEGGRDLLTYSAHQETVEELVSDAVRVAGLVPTEETVKRTLHSILSLSGEALLALAKPRPDVTMADARIAKGMLGVLTTARWYTATHADSVLVSLDEPASRLWILGGDDNRRGDLLGVRQTSEGVVVECVEVKTYEDAQAALRINGGRIEGRAATQIDQTLRLLQRILGTGDRTAIDTARKDILKDQLYRAIASRDYPADQRARFVRMLEELFSGGPHQLSALIVRVQVRSGETILGNQRPVPTISPAGNTVGVLDLLETEASLMATSPPASARRVAETPLEPAQPVNQDVVSTAELRGRASSAEEHVKIARESSIASERLQFLVGHTPSGEAVYWDPQRPAETLNNFGVLVTGDPGSGKTQVLRALIDTIARYRVPICIFDFKNDYSEQEFAEPLNLRVFDIERAGLPFNPLGIVADQNGEARPISQIHEVAAILRRVFHLGDQQEALLKRAMQQAFSDIGIAANYRQRVASLPPGPSFQSVVTILEAQGRQSTALLNRLSPLFDLGLFPSNEGAQTDWAELVNNSAVLDLHKLPDDRIKAAMAEFLIVRLHGHVLRGDQPRQLRRLLVFDEAWRVKDSERLQELAREGRAFGVGIAIGTQFPGDIPETLAGNLASQLLLHNSEIEHRKSVARTLVGSASGPIASQLISQTQALKKHEGFFRNQQYSPYVLLTTLPHYARTAKQ